MCGIAGFVSKKFGQLAKINFPFFRIESHF